jgi:hypothetical protein
LEFLDGGFGKMILLILVSRHFWISSFENSSLTTPATKTVTDGTIYQSRSTFPLSGTSGDLSIIEGKYF